MRSVLVLPVALSFVFGTAAAQDTLPTPSRWTFSVGPEWTLTPSNGHFFGGRLRAEYDLIAPTSPFRLRLEAGGFWSPTQGYFGSLSDGSTYYGVHQSMDVTFGLNVALAPLPRARFAPYVSLALLAVQRWDHGSDTFRNPDGSFAWNIPAATWTRGDLMFAAGIGMRARIGGRVFQLEMRQFRRRSLMLGTNLPF